MKDVRCKPRLHGYMSQTTMCNRSRAIQLVMITMRKSINGFSFSFLYRYCASLGGISGRRCSALTVLEKVVLISFSVKENNCLRRKWVGCKVCPSCARQLEVKNIFDRVYCSQL